MGRGGGYFLFHSSTRGCLPIDREMSVYLGQGVLLYSVCIYTTNIWHRREDLSPRDFFQ